MDLMAEESGLVGEVTTEQAKTSMSDPQVVELQEAIEKSKKKKESTNALPFYKLFSFADSIDYLLMFVGIIAAAGNGVCMPLLTILFGDSVNAFGDNSVNTKEVVHEVSKVSATKAC